MMLIVIRIMNTNQIFIKIFGEFGKNLNSFNEVIWIDCFLFWNSHSCKRQKDKKNTVANLHDCTKAWKKQTQTQTIRCKVQLIIAWLLKLKLNYSTSPHHFHIMLQIGVLPLDQFPPPLPPLAFQQVIPTICFNYWSIRESMSSNKSSQLPEVCRSIGETTSSKKSSQLPRVCRSIGESMSSNKSSNYQRVVGQLGSQWALIRAPNY